MLFKKKKEINLEDPNNHYIVMDLGVARDVLDTGSEPVEVNRKKNEWEFFFCFKDEFDPKKEEENKIINRTVKNILENILSDEREFPLLIEEMYDERAYNGYDSFIF